MKPLFPSSSSDNEMGPGDITGSIKVPWAESEEEGYCFADAVLLQGLGWVVGRAKAPLTLVETREFCCGRRS